MRTRRQERPTTGGAANDPSGKASSRRQPRRAPRDEQQHAVDVAAIHRLATRRGPDDTDLLAAYLQIGAEILGVELGVVCQLEDDRFLVQATFGALAHGPVGPGDDLTDDPRAGDVLRRAETVARLHGDHLTAEEIAAETTVEPPRPLGTGAFVATPVWVDRRVVGMVAFASDHVRLAPFGPWDLAIVELISDGVARLAETGKANEALGRSEHTTRALIAALPDRLFRIDVTGHLLDAQLEDSRRARAAGRYVGQTVEEVLAVEDAARVMAAIRAAVETGAVQTTEHEIPGEDGRHYYEARYVPCAADECLAIVRDITDRTEAEAALRRSEAQHRTVIETLDEGIVIMDPDGRPYAFNDSAVEILGLEPEQLRGNAPGPEGLRLQSVDGTELGLRDLPGLEMLRTGEPQTNVEIGIDLPGRERRWVRVNCRALQLPGDERSHVVSSFNDVTAERRSGAMLAVQVEFEGLVAAISNELMSTAPGQVDPTINRALGRVAAFFGADVGSIHELTEDGGHLRRTHEWRSEHAPARSDRDQFPVTAYPWATGQLKQEPVLYIPDPEELPPEAAAERASLEENHNRAALWVRLEGTQYSGLATLLWKQAPTSRIEALGLVRLAGETFVGAIGRRRAEALAVGQSDVLELVARGTPLGETLDAIAHLVEGHTTHVHGVISLVNEGEGSLRLTSAPTLPVPMRVFLDRWPVAPSSPIGLSAATGTPVQSIDLAGDDRFTGWAELADGHGFRAVACVPIVSSRTGRALGTLAVHGTSRRVVDDVDRKLSETAAALAAVAIERSQEESYLSYQATHDPLTGVSNRTALLDRLEHALARGRRTGQVVAVLFCDLDRFKIVNDRLGHDQGDALIVEVARRIDGVVRPTDTVARFGGDEFIVLCEDVGDEEGALMVADRIAHGIESQPVVLAGADVRVTVSIGIATSTDVADHPEALLRDADMAMYRAKARGRARREVFRESIRRAAHDREHLADELADAVENGELRLHYQPMVALADGAVQGAEALLRWQHAERGLLLPPEFVPVADATGLIVPVGRWVIDEALRQLVAWRVEAPELDGLRMHINLSVRQLAEPGFVKGLLASLKGQKVAPSSVCLEITETILMDDAPATAKAIGTLTGAGVRLALDDFGTGYASLTYLRRFPVHYLKVDRTFVGGLGRGTEDTAIVRAVVNLAHALDLEAVAEGVETAEQLGLLRALGCDGGQGFFLARPRPGDEILADLRTRLVGPALDVPVDVPVDGAPVDVAPVDVAESPSER